MSCALAEMIEDLAPRIVAVIQEREIVGRPLAPAPVLALTLALASVLVQAKAEAARFGTAVAAISS